MVLKPGFFGRHMKICPLFSKIIVYDREKWRRLGQNLWTMKEELLRIVIFVHLSGTKRKAGLSLMGKREIIRKYLKENLLDQNINKLYPNIE